MRPADAREAEVMALAGAADARERQTKAAADAALADVYVALNR